MTNRESEEVSVARYALAVPQQNLVATSAELATRSQLRQLSKDVAGALEDADAAIRLNQHNGKTKGFLEDVEINLHPLSFRPVDQVHREHDRDAEVHQLRGQVEMPFEICRIDDADDDVRPRFAYVPGVGWVLADKQV